MLRHLTVGSSVGLFKIHNSNFLAVPSAGWVSGLVVISFADARVNLPSAGAALPEVLIFSSANTAVWSRWQERKWG